MRRSMFELEAMYNWEISPKTAEAQLLRWSCFWSHVWQPHTEGSSRRSRKNGAATVGVFFLSPLPFACLADGFFCSSRRSRRSSAATVGVFFLSPLPFACLADGFFCSSRRSRRSSAATVGVFFLSPLPFACLANGFFLAMYMLVPLGHGNPDAEGRFKRKWTAKLLTCARLDSESSS